MRGAPAKAIQELAGHADLTMTQRYMHLSPAALDAAIRLLERPSRIQNCRDILATAKESVGKAAGKAEMLTRRRGACFGYNGRHAPRQSGIARTPAWLQPWHRREGRMLFVAGQIGWDAEGRIVSDRFVADLEET